MRVLVCGGRDYTDYWVVDEVLTGMHRSSPFTALIEGGALGADRFARAWAQRNGVPVETFKADWEKEGRAAGPIRNQRMLTVGKPDRVVAFPGGKGTANMMALALAADVPVVEIAE